MWSHICLYFYCAAAVDSSVHRDYTRQRFAQEVCYYIMPCFTLSCSRRFGGQKTLLHGDRTNRSTRSLACLNRKLVPIPQGVQYLERRREPRGGAREAACRRGGRPTPRGTYSLNNEITPQYPILRTSTTQLRLHQKLDTYKSNLERYDCYVELVRIHTHISRLNPVCVSHHDVYVVRCVPVSLGYAKCFSGLLLSSEKSC